MFEINPCIENVFHQRVPDFCNKGKVLKIF